VEQHKIWDRRARGTPDEELGQRPSSSADLPELEPLGGGPILWLTGQAGWKAIAFTPAQPPTMPVTPPLLNVEKLPQRAAILRAVPKGRPDRFQEDDFSRTSWCLKIDRSRNSNKALHGARMYDYRYIYLITINARPPPETKGSRANELAIGPTVSAEGV